MKIALITDTHWGVRNDNPAFLDNTKKFLDDVFFKTIDKAKITTVIHLGDLVDRRKYININTARRLREDFLDRLDARKIDYLQIAGNHDTYFKNTNEVNSIKELVEGRYTRFGVIDKDPIEVEYDGLKILLLPWICDENYERTIETIKQTTAPVCFGHLELMGFEMYKGSVNDHGMASSIFDKFDMVCSGHYHHRSTNGSIYYLGSHGEFTWSDYDDPRGFHIFDTRTRELTFVENPYTMFAKAWYDDSSEDFLNNPINYAQYKNKIVKVIVKNKTNPYWFDMFIDNLEKAGTLDLQVVDDHLNLQLEDDTEIVNEAEDTLTIFRKHIDQLSMPNLNKKKLETAINVLYNEALAVE